MKLVQNKRKESWSQVLSQHYNKRYSLVFRDVPFKIFSYLYYMEKNSRIKTKDKRINATTLSKRIDATYSHLLKTLKVFEELGLIDVIKEGRTMQVKISKNGYEIAFDVLTVASKLRQLKFNEIKESENMSFSVMD